MVTIVNHSEHMSNSESQKIIGNKLNTKNLKSTIVNFIECCWLWLNMVRMVNLGQGGYHVHPQLITSTIFNLPIINHRDNAQHTHRHHVQRAHMHL